MDIFEIGTEIRKQRQQQGMRQFGVITVLQGCWNAEISGVAHFPMIMEQSPSVRFR